MGPLLVPRLSRAVLSGEPIYLARDADAASLEMARLAVEAGPMQ
jgi:hypothetical protein